MAEYDHSERFREPRQDLRIEMDRRIVYGRPSKAAFRNELTPQQMQRLFQGFQQPAAPDVNPSAYQGVIPAIEVKRGDEILFRQERDGTVTLNQIQQSGQQADLLDQVGSEESQPVKEGFQGDDFEAPWSAQDADRDGLTNGEEARIGTDPYSADTDRDGISDLQEVVLGTDPAHPDTDRDGIPDGAEVLAGSDPTSAPPASSSQYSYAQDPAIPSLDSALESDLEAQSQPVDPSLDASPEVTEPAPVIEDAVPETASALQEAQPPSFIDTLYQRLYERSDVDLNRATLAVYQGQELLYQSSPQAEQYNDLAPEQNELFQQILDDPSGLQGELKIMVNDEMIFHAKNGEVKVDLYGLVENQQAAEAQTQEQQQDSPGFDAAALYSRYQQETQSGSQAPIDLYERIAQRTLDEGLSPEQAKEVLRHDPFYQTLAAGLGPQEADRYSEHLLNSLGYQAAKERISTLESRVENLETFNKYLSAQLDTLNQKLDRLSQSNAAFQSSSPGLSQFLNNIQTSVANTWESAKSALRQKAGEVSLSVLAASAKTTTQLFGEESKEGLRVIEARGQRVAVNEQGYVQIGKVPELQAVREYQRLSQRADLGQPPSVQAKQIAQVALKEKFTESQIHSILREHPKVKEIESNLGAGKARQFASVAIAAAQRQNLIDSRPKQQESQRQPQAQPQA